MTPEKPIDTASPLIELDTPGFETARAESGRLLLVEYFAEHCVWCERIEPVLAAAEADYRNHVRMVKINSRLNPEALPEGGIRGTPTVALYRNGKLLMMKHGMMQRAQLKSFLDHWLDPANEGLSGS